ncbi:MAG TPA: cytochrome-c oxidase, cbb3-type subunit III [Caldimonas sp.]|nr:cytochrome-c oxidase, cbb3-type subunit III [Caldimonas sp.]
MSDFFSNGWSVFIAVAAVAGLVACLVLLVFASRRQTMAADNSTGHVFDEDLVEMNNPLPMWWIVLFVVTVVFALAYVYVYPGLGAAPGAIGWTSRGELAADQARANEASAKVHGAYAQRRAPELSRDPAAMAIGQRLFLQNCAQCHGSDARGSKGFPNLTDDDWLHGGTPEKIEETITLGRIGVMPPMAAAVGTATDVHNVANYVLSLSGSPHNAIAAAEGRKKFVVCARCHGADGKGNQAIGAPNLTDKIWLHGWGEDAIVTMVNEGKTNVMPAQSGRLTPAQIHLLASYVWSLSQVRPTALQ